MKSNNLPASTPANPEPDAELTPYWASLRETDYTGTFSQTTAWVHRQDQKASQPLTWPAQLRQVLAGTRLRLAYAILILAFLAGACNYPVETNQPLATVLRWEVAAEDAATLQALDALPWLQQGPIVVNEKNLNGTTLRTYTFTSPTTDPDQIQSYRENLASLTGVRDLTLLPVSAQETKPLYAAALQRLFKIEVDATGMPAAELEQALQAQLRAGGIQDLTVQVVTDANGKRRIQTKIADSPGAFGVDLTVKDGREVTRIREEIRHRPAPGPGAPDLKNLSDAELKKFIIRDHPRLHLKPENIQITRKGNQISIQVETPSGEALKLELR